jgi:AcrR family transcriptional regulator
MAGQRNLTIDAVILAAAQIAEEGGVDNLNLNSIATALGIKTPSLYNHVKGIEDVRQRLARYIFEKMELAVKNAAVGRSKEEAIQETAHAYRCFAQQHPQLYRVFTNAPGTEDGRALLDTLSQTMTQILSGFKLETHTRINFIRLFHSAIHGFVSLENTGFFTIDVDVNESFQLLVDGQITILKDLGGQHNERN